MQDDDKPVDTQQNPNNQASDKSVQLDDMQDDVGAPYTEADVISAHEKQKKKFLGQGNIKFTAAEQHVLDNDIYPPEPPTIAA